MSLLPVKKPEESQEKFVCDLCEKVFDSKGPMSNHRILVHTIRTNEIHCDFCEDIFSTKKDLCSHISKSHSEHFNKQEPGIGEVKEDKVELNYILDEVKNLKVPKTNARRALIPKRKDIDDHNVMFELNSALYLISKDELLKMSQRQPEEKNGVKLLIESKTEQVDKKENNPATIVKLKVTNLGSQFESKVTMNLYHSSQGVHLQGGRRQGKVTSCLLVATYLKEFFKETLENKKPLIRKVKETRLQIDMRKNYHKKQTPKSEKINKKDNKVTF